MYPLYHNLLPRRFAVSTLLLELSKHRAPAVLGLRRSNRNTDIPKHRNNGIRVFHYKSFILPPMDSKAMLVDGVFRFTCKPFPVNFFGSCCS
jgi:hypothetical protein